MGPMAAMWLLSLCVLPEDHQVKTRGDLKAKMKAFDKAGTLLFIAFSGCGLMGLNRGNDLGWDSNVVLGFFIAALALLPVLIVVERRAPEPILPFSLIFADSTAMKCLLLGAGSQTTHTGSYNILPIFMQLAQGWSPYEAGLVLFCRPLGGFLCSLVISRLMRRDAVPLHWLIRLGSLSQCCAFLTLYFLAHQVERGNPAQLRPLIMSVLILQAGGSSGCNIPAQAILVARMPANRLASIQRCARSTSPLAWQLH